MCLTKRKGLESVPLQTLGQWDLVRGGSHKDSYRMGGCRLSRFLLGSQAAWQWNFGPSGAGGKDVASFSISVRSAIEDNATVVRCVATRGVRGAYRGLGSSMPIVYGGGLPAGYARGGFGRGGS